MKKNLLIIGILALLILILILYVYQKRVCSVSYIVEETLMDEFNITEARKELSNNIFKRGCVRDEKAAAEIATTIFRSIYGKKFNNGLPLLVTYDEQEQWWLIKTQLPDEMAGGEKYIIIRKSNAEVVGIWAYK